MALAEDDGCLFVGVLLALVVSDKTLMVGVFPALVDGLVLFLPIDLLVLLYPSRGLFGSTLSRFKFFLGDFILLLFCDLPGLLLDRFRIILSTDGADSCGPS